MEQNETNIPNMSHIDKILNIFYLMEVFTAFKIEFETVYFYKNEGKSTLVDLFFTLIPNNIYLK